MKNDWFPLIALLGIICIALFGGVKNASQNQTQNTAQNQDVYSNNIPTPEERQMSQDEIAGAVYTTQQQTNDLQKKVADAQDAKISSEFKNKITFSWGGSSTTDPNQEYLQIDARSDNTVPIKITGWTITSTSTGQTITVPKSTNLYFSNSNNSDEDIWVYPGERVYIITGRSPIGYGLHANICSGYLSQFNNFNPGLYTSCPVPRNEKAVDSIPRTINNNNCFDLIDSLSSCRTYTEQMDNRYSAQCQNFVQTKVNYQACVDIHKNDKDFWSPKLWYVYLKREYPIWQQRRETLILKDSIGKQVMKISRY